MSESAPPSIDAELSDIFALFDKDGDGLISFKEFHSALLIAGIHASKDELQVLFNKADKNSDGQLEISEFVSLMKSSDLMHEPHQDEETPTETARKLFKAFDLNGDGYISDGELRQLFNVLGENVTEGDISSMMAISDKNGDGKIEFEEFFKIYESTMRKRQ